MIKKARGVERGEKVLTFELSYAIYSVYKNLDFV